MTLRETTNRAKNFLHGRCITNDLRCPAFSRFFRGFQLGVSLGLRSSDGGYHLIYIEGLGQIFESAFLISVHCAVEIGVRGGDDDRQIRLLCADLCQ